MLTADAAAFGSWQERDAILNDQRDGINSELPTCAPFTASDIVQFMKHRYVS
jgi:hypothetical protein